ncbi:MAG: DNA alkylation repair protein [Dehalococcoidia bacterium]
MPGPPSFDITALQRLAALFPQYADPAKAAAMRKYMRNLFPFLGIPSPARRELQRKALAGLARPTEGELGVLAGHLWELSEREYQYAAMDILAKHVRVCGPGFLAAARTLITTKSWWDTVDGLAADVAGDLVRRFPELAVTMDAWVESDNLWLRRTALIHQLRYKEKTDTERLFRYCLARAGETDFFIRKAIGWAVRQYSWTDPGAVAAFVAAHEAELSPLSRREALLAIRGGRKHRPAPP